MEKHDKEEFRDALGQPNPAHDLQLKTIREKEERDKEAAKEAKSEESDNKKAKK